MKTLLDIVAWIIVILCILGYLGFVALMIAPDFWLFFKFAIVVIGGIAIVVWATIRIMK